MRRSTAQSKCWLNALVIRAGLATSRPRGCWARNRVMASRVKALNQGAGDCLLWLPMKVRRLARFAWGGAAVKSVVDTGDKYTRPGSQSRNQNCAQRRKPSRRAHACAVRHGDEMVHKMMIKAIGDPVFLDTSLA